MTPEERFTKMENLLQAMMEHQARQQEHLDKQQKYPDKQQEHLERQGEEISKQNTGIRDLIVVSRTILTNTEKVTEQINQLREAQARTDERLNILVAEVNRVIRAFGKNGTP